MNCPLCAQKLPNRIHYFFSFGSIKTCPSCQKNFELSVNWLQYLGMIMVWIISKNIFIEAGGLPSFVDSILLGLVVGCSLVLSWRARKIPE